MNSEVDDTPVVRVKTHPGLVQELSAEAILANPGATLSEKQAYLSERLAYAYLNYKLTDFLEVAVLLEELTEKEAEQFEYSVAYYRSPLKEKQDTFVFNKEYLATRNNKKPIVIVQIDPSFKEIAILGYLSEQALQEVAKLGTSIPNREGYYTLPISVLKHMRDMVPAIAKENRQNRPC